VRRAAIAALAVALACSALVPQRACGEDDASHGYETVRASLVKVWAFDSGGRPVESGSGIVVASSDKHSYILTAQHVIAKAAVVRIDIDRRVHDVPARVAALGPRDLALLAVDRGGLVPVTFAPHERAIVEGNVVAVAGYVKHDELIGIVGQEPRLLYPGTISSRPDDGMYLELENVHIEEGLSGGPVFDPQTGAVLGIVTSRTTDARGGFADSVPLIVLAFLNAQHVAFATAHAPAIAHIAAPVAAAQHPATPVPVARRAAEPKPQVALAAPPSPAEAHRLMPVAPAPPPRTAPGAIAQAPRPASNVYWSVVGSPVASFTYQQQSCTIAESVQILSLALAVSAHGLSGAAARPNLTLAVRRRTPLFYGCAAFRDNEAVAGDYEAVASAFDGHHLTVRYAFAGPHGTDANAPAQSAADALFPSDVSLDVEFGNAPIVATLQLFDANWNGALDVDLSRADAGAISVANP
jgi:hypothetical protein